jgi:hypothetical protein
MKKQAGEYTEPEKEAYRAGREYEGVAVLGDINRREQITAVGLKVQQQVLPQSALKMAVEDYNAWKKDHPTLEDELALKQQKESKKTEQADQ